MIRLPLWAVLCVAAPLAAQKPPRMDSLIVRLAKPKAEAMDLVVLAFTQVGLAVTNQTGSLVESDQGGNEAFALGGQYRRVARAFVLGNDSSATILLTGQEVTTIRKPQMETRQSVSNRSKGGAAALWRKMLAVVWALDPAQVPSGARP